MAGERGKSWSAENQPKVLRHEVQHLPGESESQKQSNETLKREKHKKCRKYLLDSSLKLSTESR